MIRPLDGRHVSAILVAGFAVVIAVNLTAAVAAKRTFGGIVVENSYVASQDFNRWLAEAERERALGWKVTPRRREDGRIALEMAGVPTGAVITAHARHPLGHLPDRSLAFDPAGISRERLPRGRWTLRFTITADGRSARMESSIP